MVINKNMERNEIQMIQAKETIEVDESWDWQDALNDDNDTCGCYDDEY